MYYFIYRAHQYKCKSDWPTSKGTLQRMSFTRTNQNHDHETRERSRPRGSTTTGRCFDLGVIYILGCGCWGRALLAHRNVVIMQKSLRSCNGCGRPQVAPTNAAAAKSISVVKNHLLGFLNPIIWQSVSSC